VQGVEYDLTTDAWTMVAFNNSAAIVVPPAGARVRGRKAGEDLPSVDTLDFFVIRSMRIIQGIAPFEALWLRADAGPVTVTVYEGNTMSGVVYFGKSPFRVAGPSSTTITVPFVPQTLDGGAPDTDYVGLAVIDCGGPATDPTLRTIDGRSPGVTP
jgi:hypothetical protein